MRLRGWLAASLGAVFLCLNATAGASGGYASIRDLRKTLPQRWTGEYVVAHGDGVHLMDGDTVKVDVPVIVPEVEKVPAVRITWGGPYTDLNESVVVDENTENHLVAEFPVAPGQGFSREQAAETYIRILKENIGEMEERALTNYLLREETSEQYGRRFWMAFCSSFHGIPYLIGQNFRLEAPGEKEGDLPPVPANVSQGALLADRVGVTLCAPRETGVDRDDLPLLDFGEILKVFEQWVKDGYVYSLEEMRFGYMAFIDPKRKGEEFVLLPVWTAKGITRGTLSMPFCPSEDPESLAFMAYMNPTVCAVNAQTGERFAFAEDTRAERRYLPAFLTWDDVMKSQ